MLVVFILLTYSVTFAQSKKTEINTVKIKIKVSEIPTAITKTLNKEYTNFVAEKAFKTKMDNKQAYFISLIKDEVSTAVYIDTKGKILNKKNN